MTQDEQLATIGQMCTLDEAQQRAAVQVTAVVRARVAEQLDAERVA